MRGQEMTLKTEADNTVCASFYVYKQPRWQWAFRKTECDPITCWHHRDKREWELNHFDEPISSACQLCKPNNAITPLATSGTQKQPHHSGKRSDVHNQEKLFFMQPAWIALIALNQSFNSRMWQISYLTHWRGGDGWDPMQGQQSHCTLRVCLQ